MKTDRLLATLVVILVGLPFVLATYAVLARYVLHGPVDGRSLGRSVAQQTAWGDRGSCRRAAAEGEWVCELSEASTTRRYRVVVERGGSCWGATRSVAPRPERLSGCVRRWQGSLF